MKTGWRRAGPLRPTPTPATAMVTVSRPGKPVLRKVREMSWPPLPHFYLFTHSSTIFVCVFIFHGVAGGRRAKRVPRPDAADRAEAAAAAAERARSQYFLKSSEANGDDSDSSSDSDTEGQHILSDGPADRGVEQGTWWHSFSR